MPTKKPEDFFFFSDVDGARVFSFLRVFFFFFGDIFFCLEGTTPFLKSVASLNKIGRYFVASEITVWHPET